MEKIVSRITLLFLSGCCHFGGVDWAVEYKNTQYKNTISSVIEREPTMNRAIVHGRLKNGISLNKAGIAKMESDGCTSCHIKGGGERPSIYIKALYTSPDDTDDKLIIAGGYIQ